MTFAFLPADLCVQDGIKRMAVDQIDTALADLEDFELSRDEAIHSVRTHCKRLRGLLRFVGPDLKTFDKESVAVRDTARLFSAERDRDVLLILIDQLGAAATSEASARLLAHAYAVVTEAYADNPGLEPANGVELVSARLRKIRKRVHGWRVGGKRRALPSGVRMTYRQGQRALEKAVRTTNSEPLHDWRKHVKYHMYHLRLLAPTAPEMMAAHRKIAKLIANHLGDHQDLSLLTAHLVDGRLLTKKSDRRALVDLLRPRLARHRSEALRLGRMMYAETDDALERRLKSYWKVYWRQDRDVAAHRLAAE